MTGFVLAAGDITLTGVAPDHGGPRGYFVDGITGQPFSLAVGESVGECRLLRLAGRSGRAWIEYRGVTNEVTFASAPSVGRSRVAPALAVKVRTEIQPPTGDPPSEP